METKKVLIIGDGGNACVIAFSLIDAYKKGNTDFIFSGFVSNNTEITEIEGYPIIGNLNKVQELLEKGFYFINCQDKMGSQKELMNLIDGLQIPDDRWVTFIHPMAYVDPQVKMGPGCVVFPNAIVQPGTTLGKCCTIMFGAIMGHDNLIGKFCHFDCGSISGAFLKVGDGVFVSTNATIRENCTIDNYSKIGMGAVLTKSVGEGETWVGNPAILHKKN